MNEENKSGVKPADDVILSVKNLTVDFKSDEGYTQAVRGVSFDLKRGETLCIVGESGSGKSVSCKTIMGILSGSAVIRSGSITYRGEDLTKISEDEFHRIRGNLIGMIFQDPLSALDPIVRIGKQITESMMVNKDRLKVRRDNLILKESSAYNSIVAQVKKARGALRILRADKAELKKLKETTAVSNGYKLDDMKAAHAEILSIHPEQKSKLLAAEDAYKQQLAEERKEFLANKLVQIKERRAQAKADLKRIKAESKAPRRAAYKALKQAKKRAEGEIAQFKKEAILEYRRTRSEIEKQYPADQIDKQYKKDLKAFKNERIRIERLRHYDLASINRKRTLHNANIASEIKACNIKYDAMVEKARVRIVGASEKLYRERQDKLDQNYFHNYCEKIKYSKKYAKARALEVMKEVGIPQAEKRFTQYPFEFSGGMRQRIVIAIALTANPEILICDEPTTALDVTIQAQILELINNLKRQHHMSVIFITHDMGVVAEMADRICVMYAGKIVEYGTSYDIFYNPKHPYTWALLSSIPDLDSKEKLEAIPGTPPNMNFPPEGDAFALRSKYAMSIDFKKMPPFFKVSKTHYAATWLLDPRAPKVDMPKIVSRRIENSLKRAGVTYEQLEQQEESD